jgi:lysozyme
MSTIKQRVAVALLTASAALVGGLQLREGKSNDAYVDTLATTKVVTICYGDTGGYKVGDHRTDRQCSELLARKLETVYAPIVRKYVTVPLSQGEFDALVDFAYNLGEGNFRSSTLLAKLNAGDRAGAAAEFSRWYKTNGKDCRIRANKCYGIIERRVWEKTTFES